MPAETLDVYKEWLGIPEGPRPPDNYQLLRLVQFEDATEKIRANYKKLNAHVRKYATGQYSVRSQELLNELAKAMLCLTDVERKKEYDLSLGREFDEEQGGRKTMDVLLLEQKQISQMQLKEAREYAEKLGLELRDSLVQLKMVEPAVAAQALALELGLPYVDLTDMLPDDDVLDKVPRELAKQHSILPLFIDDDVLLVACVQLLDHELLDELRLRFNVPVRPVLTAPLAITQGLAKYYASGMRNAVAVEAVPSGKEQGKDKKAAKAAAKPQAAKKSPASPEARKEKRMIGIITLNFSFVLSYLLDSFVIHPGAGQADVWLYVVLPGITAAAVWATCFRK